MTASTLSKKSSVCRTVRCCEIKVERCQDGCKIYCCCDDEAACSLLQELCSAMASGQCSVCCTNGGVTVCNCCFTGCCCECQCTADGVCITCTSDDRDCCAMIQAMCDCICRCQSCGCECTVCLDGAPVCCCKC